MKWYNSVKTKMVGFFLLVAIVFLTTMVIIFSIIILDLTLLMMFFAIVRIAIGVGTVIVDGWFLTHI